MITVHNHSAKVQKPFSRTFAGGFYNLIPTKVYANYLKSSDMLSTGMDGDNLVLCAPDKGALPFVNLVHESLGYGKVARIVMEKVRTGSAR